MSTSIDADTLVRDLVAARYRRGLTQTDIAQLLDIPRSNVAKFELCHNSPKLETILRYAKAVGVRVAFEIEGLLA